MTSYTYTVLNRAGEVMGRGLTTEEAAGEVLRYDGADYDIRCESLGFRLITKGTCGKWSAGSVVCFGQVEKSRARERIFAQVVEMARSGKWFPEGSGCQVMTDAEYDAVLADLAANP